MYKDTFREAKIKLEDIPKTLRFQNENDLISSRLEMMMKEEKDDREEESKTSSKSSKENNNKEEEDMFLDLEQDQDDVPWLDTVDLVKKFRELDTCFLNSKLVRRILKTSKNIPQDVRGSEFRVDYETYASVGEFPYFSLGHGLISRGLRSRKFRYLYDNESRRFIFQRMRVFCMIFAIIPLIVMLPLASLLDISKEWREVLLTFSVSAPILFLGAVLFVALRGATPNPLKRAFGPLVSWYLLTTIVPLTVIVLILEDVFAFDYNSTKWFVFILQIPFPFANLGFGIFFLTRKNARRWIRRLTIEERFVSRPSSLALSLMLVVLPFIPVVQLVSSALMFMYSENRINIAQFTSTYVVTMMLTSLLSLFLVVFGILGTLLHISEHLL